jgi:hypothetical protein
VGACQYTIKLQVGQTRDTYLGHGLVVVVLEREVTLLASPDRLVRRLETDVDLSSVVEEGMGNGGRVGGEEAWWCQPTKLISRMTW